MSIQARKGTVRVSDKCLGSEGHGNEFWKGTVEVGDEC